MGDLAIAVITIVGAVLYLYVDSSIPAGGLDDIGPAAFPAIIGIGLLLSGVLLVFETRRKRRVVSAATTTPAPWVSKHQLVLLAMLIWTAAYYYAFEPVGYLLATTIFLLPMLAVFNRGRWVMNVLVAVGFTLVAYVMFAKLLKVNLPAGLWSF